MPTATFKVYNTAEETLQIWQRQLNFLFQNLDQSNITNTGIILGPGQVKASNIQFGTGADQVDASDIPIVDAGNLYAGGTVEVALAEAATNLNAHTGSTSIHYATTSIDHTGIKNIGANTHAQIDTHIATTNIHYLTTNIDHAELKNIGTKTHAQIDSILATLTTQITSTGNDLELNATDYIDIKAKNVIYKDTVWDDVVVPSLVAKITGVNDPTLETFKTNGAGSTGVATYHFSPTVRQDVYFSVQMPHTFKQGGTISPHVHWSPVTTNAGNVIWQFEYTLANYQDNFPNTVIDSVTEAANSTAYAHKIAGFTDINSTDLRVSSIFLCRVSRDAANVADTYPDKAALLSIDFHHEINKLGTESPFST